MVATVAALSLSTAAFAADPEFAFEVPGGAAGAPQDLVLAAAGITTDADGNVWVADPGRNRIVKYDYNGGFVAAFTQPEGGTPFVDPQGVGADNQGFVYVADAGPPSQVVRIDTGGRLSRVFGPGGPDGANLTNANAVAVDNTDGAVYVADGGRVARYLADGTPFGAFPVGVSAGLAINDTAGQVFVADNGAVGGPLIRRFGRNLVQQASFGGPTVFSGSLGELAIEPDGVIDVADFGGGTIRRFTGARHRATGARDSGHGSGPDQRADRRGERLPGQRLRPRRCRADDGNRNLEGGEILRARKRPAAGAGRARCRRARSTFR